MKEEITLFKYYHVGKAALSKMEKEIKKTDIVMREAPTITEKEVKYYIENKHKLFLKKKFKNRVELRAFLYKEIGDNHWKEIRFLLHKYQKPFLMAEVYTKGESQNIKKMHKKSLELRAKSFNALKEGNAKVSLKNLKKADILSKELLNRRDERIAKVLLNEKKILDYYPELSKLKKLKILCLIGGSHNPENYIKNKKETKIIIKRVKDLEDKDVGAIKGEFPLFWIFIRALKNNGFNDKKIYPIAKKISEKLSEKMVISFCNEVKKNKDREFNQLAFEFFKKQFPKELK